MDACDVAIVGGGPAGSSCAWWLRRHGVDVVVLDRSRFPRDKVCAGWVTPPVLEALQVEPDAYAKERVLQPIRGFRVGLAGARSTVVDCGEVVSYGIRRCEFDDFLLARSGARLRQGEPLRSLEREGDAWILNGALRARIVVGAGGHFCPVARRLAPRPRTPEPVIAAREMEIELSDGEAERLGPSPEYPELCFERDLAGYGWRVRKGRWINIGLGRQARDLNTELDRFLDDLRRRAALPRASSGRFRGHAYLLHGQSGRPPSSEGALLVGDALGLAYPRSGEGIRPAVESGLLAADVLLELPGARSARALQAYDHALRERFGPGEPDPSGGLSSWLPSGVRPWIAARLLSEPRFARHVLVDRWFLHRDQPALQLDGEAVPDPVSPRLEGGGRSGTSIARAG